MRILLAAVLLVGCGKSKKEEAQAKVDEFILKSVTGDLAKAKAEMSGPKPFDAMMSCATALAGKKDMEDAGETAVLKDLTETCEHDVLLASMRTATEKAEAARKAKPDEKVLMACYDAYYDIALRDLRKYKREDDAAKAIEARYDAVCPPKK